MSVMTSPSTVLYGARKGPRPFTALDLWAIPRVGAPVPSPDGRTVAVSVTTYDVEKNEGRCRIWLVPAAGGEPRALTAPEHSSQQPAFSPDGRQLAFTRKGEKGKPQLHVMPLDGGEPRKLLDLPLGVFDPRWLPDGSGIVFAAMVLKGHFTPEATAAELERRDKDPVKAHVTEDRLYRYWDTWLTTGEVPHLFLYDLAGGKLRDLTPESTLWFDWMDPSGQYDIAPDGREIVFAGIAYDETKAILRSAIHTVPVAGGAVRCLTSDHPSDDTRPRYSPDGKNIVYGMQRDPFFYADRVRLMRFDRAAKQHEPLLENWTLSPAHWEFAGDGALVLEAESAGRLGVFALRPGAEPRPLTERGTASGMSVARDGRVFFALQSLSEPAEAYGCAADGRGLTRLTRFTAEATARFGMGEVREMQFEGGQGETVQMYVILPPDYQPGKKYPLVQVIHGGPHAISGDQFHPRWNGQLFSAPGYVTALVNFQGSTSWGQDFAERIQAAWGERPFEDVMRATDLLIASGLVDESRMAAAGGSYGGYMASWIEAHTDRFRCIVNHAGVYDTLSQYASDVTQGRSRAFGGEPWEGIEAIDRYNPARFAKGFVTPMLVTHGERDYRVPVAQGLECYGVLKAKGVPARLVYFPDENHWVLKPRNSLLWYREVQDWLARWFGGKGGSGRLTGVRTKAPYMISVAALAAGVSLALGGDPLSEHGPLPSYTGAPAIHSKPEELNCSFCHLNFDWNNLNTKGGSVKILDLPKTYTAGQTYRFRVRLMTDSTATFSGRKWGFQLTAVRASDGEGCGTFVLDDPDTLQVVPAEDPGLGSRKYVQHTFMGVREGLGGPVEWTFSWRAPDAPEDTALFYCAGNAANGSFDPSGDFIFTTADTVLDLTTPTIPVSWGEVKRRYR